MLRLTQPTNFETLHSNLHVLKGGDEWKRREELRVVGQCHGNPVKVGED